MKKLLLFALAILSLAGAAHAQSGYVHVLIENSDGTFKDAGTIGYIATVKQ